MCLQFACNKAEVCSGLAPNGVTVRDVLTHCVELQGPFTKLEELLLQGGDWVCLALVFTGDTVMPKYEDAHPAKYVPVVTQLAQA